jgi:hypothetical protein
MTYLHIITTIPLATTDDFDVIVEFVAPLVSSDMVKERLSNFNVLKSVHLSNLVISTVVLGRLL